MYEKVSMAQGAEQCLWLSQCHGMPQGWAALGSASGLCPRAAQTLNVLCLSQHRAGCRWKWWVSSSPNSWEYERLRLVTIF